MEHYGPNQPHARFKFNGKEDGKIYTVQDEDKINKKKSATECKYPPFYQLLLADKSASFVLSAFFQAIFSDIYLSPYKTFYAWYKNSQASVGWSSLREIKCRVAGEPPGLGNQKV